MDGEVRIENFLPFSLRFEDEFDGVAQGSVASGVRRGEVSFLFHVGAGIPYRDGEASEAHSGEVDDVVAHEGGFVGSESGLTDDLLKGSTLVVAALANKLEFQIAGAQGNGFGIALGNESGAKSAETGYGDGDSVVSVKSLELDRSLGAQLG